MALTAENLHGAAIAAYENARDLLEEAKLLYDNGRWARTFFLSCIAAEEFGKVLTCIAAIVQVREGNFDEKAVLREFRSHRGKMNMMIALEDNLLRQTVSDNEIARRTAVHPQDVVKMSSLYADFYELDNPATVVSAILCK